MPSLKKVNLLEVGITWFYLVEPYIVFTLITIFLMITISKKYHKENRYHGTLLTRSASISIYTQLLFLIVVFFSAFRIIESNKGGIFYENNQLLIYPGGIDAPAYKRMFEVAKENNLFDYFKLIREEPIYNFSCWFFAKIFGQYTFFLSFYYIVYAISFISYCKSFSFSRHVTDVLCLFCILALFLQGFNTFRWTTCIFFSIFIVGELFEKKIQKAVFYTIILCGIHITAIIWLLPITGVYIIKKNRSLRNSFFLVYILFLLFLMIGFLVFFPWVIQGSRYVQYARKEFSISSVWLLTYFFMIFHVYIKRKYFFKNANNKVLFTIALCFMPLFILQSKYAICYRFMLYSKPYVYLILLNLSKIEKKNNYYLFTILDIISNIVFIGTLITFFSTQIISVGLPYRNYLFNL